MKKFIIVTIVTTLAVCLLTGCQYFFTRITPPEWIWGSWEGVLEEENHTYQYLWDFTKNSAEYQTIFENDTTGYIRRITSANYIDDFSTSDDGKEQYIIEVSKSTRAHRKFIFTKIDDNTVELLEVRDETREYPVKLIRKSK